MDSVLYKIIEIERAAQSISEEAAKARRELPVLLEAERARFSALINKETDGEIERLSAEERQTEERKLMQIEEEFDRQKKMLTELFRQNKEKWVSDIYGKIIGKK